MIGTGLSLTQLAIRQYLGYSPGSLFSSGEQGVWYDPSDMSTLFEDSAGTIPITAVERPVGLMLDKSKGLALGPNLFSLDLLTNTINTGWTYQGGVFSVDTPLSYSYASLNVNGAISLPTIAGRSYELHFTVAALTGGVGAAIGTGGIAASSGFRSSGTYKVIWRCERSGFGINIQCGSNFTGSITIHSARELSGNHTTSSSANRPILSARYNLLTKTEQFDDAVWIKNQGCSISTTNSAIAPDETLTADTYTQTATPGAARITQDSPILSTGLTLKLSVSLKPKTGTWARLILIDATNTNGCVANINLQTGQLGITTTIGSGASLTSATIAAENNGFFRCSLVGTTTGGVYRFFMDIVDADGSTTRLPNGEMYIWGADLRVANDGVGLPTYQRVNTSTDYDTAGFSTYLLFNGTNSWMQTNSINFTSTDKMTVLAGVRKFGANFGIIVGLSSSINENNGSFELFAPYSTDDYQIRSRGTLTAFASRTGYAPPTTNIINFISNISGPSLVLRVDNTQVASSTSTQGTGTYGNYPLFIGSRGNSSLWFNGRIYSLIVRGAQSSDNQITKTEIYVGKKTGFIVPEIQGTPSIGVNL